MGAALRATGGILAVTETFTSSLTLMSWSHYIVLSLCKMLPQGKLGKEFRDSLYYFLKLHENL